MPELPLADITLHYESEGSGPPLLMLAGMLSDSASWAALAPKLTPHFTVIRPDNRTTGRTTPWDAPVSVGQMADDAIALMAHLGHERFHLVGHSMGGLMAMELAAAVPDKVMSLCILASAPVRVPRTMAVFNTLYRIRCAPDGAELWLRALYPWIFTPAFFADPQNTENALAAAQAYPYGQTAPAMAHQIEALGSFRPRGRAADISCPTKVIYAADDLLIPEKAARDAFSAIPKVEQITLPDAGHSIHWDAPDEVARHILDFATRHPAGQTTAGAAS